MGRANSGTIRDWSTPPEKPMHMGFPRSPSSANTASVALDKARVTLKRLAKSCGQQRGVMAGVPQFEMNVSCEYPLSLKCIDNLFD